MGTKGININLDTPRRRRGNWKKKLLLYIFLLAVGFLAGFQYDLQFLKDTHFDKEKIIEKIEAENLQLEKTIDSLEQIQIEVKETIRVKIKEIEKYTDEELQDWFNNRYDK